MGGKAGRPLLGERDRAQNSAESPALAQLIFLKVPFTLSQNLNEEQDILAALGSRTNKIIPFLVINNNNNKDRIFSTTQRSRQR